MEGCPSGFSDARRQHVPRSDLDRNQAFSNLICTVMVTGWIGSTSQRRYMEILTLTGRPYSSTPQQVVTLFAERVFAAAVKLRQGHGGAGRAPDPV